MIGSTISIDWRETMLSEAPDDSVTDYYGEFSEEEVEALRDVVKRADGRRKETKLAREALGIHD
jgi:hypothetical protein